MRFAKIHPSFLIFFGLSLASFAVALVVAITSMDACTSSSGDQPDSACAVRGQGEGTTATVLAIGGLAAMLGGVGFQIGRATPAAAPVAVPLGGAPAPYPLQPAYPSAPGAPGYPPAPGYPAPPASAPPASMPPAS
ncbi:hypothetical protein [Rugosimonospora africana]|uniref:hypothetical protein n=1 Tax=Rugosimonospora africana TaxID=556532 RepID=UPI001945822F|nr:hypothetical protein [Rugosimonospora africana]